MIDHLEIEKAAQLIQKGELVAFPTETVYGLGANALDAYAVAKIFEIKERPSFDPLIAHIASLDMLKLLSDDIDSRVYKLAEAFWPGPLTIVIPRSKNVPDIVCSGLPTVAVRMPDHKVALALIKKANCPIAAPSANKFGKLSPTQAQHVLKNLQGVSMVLDGGPVKVGIESTIIKLDDTGFRILRPGIITAEEIIQVVPLSDEALQEGILAPGMVKSHYSPELRTVLVSSSNDIPHELKRNSAYLPFDDDADSEFKIVIRPAEDLDLRKYATSIFSILHELQESDIDCIYIQTVPKTGIGIAIMDRLEKAAYRHTI